MKFLFDPINFKDLLLVHQMQKNVAVLTYFLILIYCVLGSVFRLNASQTYYYMQTGTTINE